MQKTSWEVMTGQTGSVRRWVASPKREKDPGPKRPKRPDQMSAEELVAHHQAQQEAKSHA